MRNSHLTVEKIPILIKLERRSKEVEQLHLKLDSYRCTPKTQGLFNQKENLKSDLNQLVETTHDLMLTLKNLDIASSNYNDDIERKFEEFNEIHQEVNAYVDVVRN
ncbi:hypothetical protein OAE12_01590 [bacterium]|nr:hypothetical protein [bacterium]